MKDDSDSFTVNYGPLKRSLSTVGTGFLGGAAIAGVGLINLLYVALMFAFAALLYWISDRAYEVSWVIGFPLRIIAFMSALGAFFALLGAVIKIVLMIGVAVWMMVQSALGRDT